jgi:hypothetical protein
MDFLTGWNFVHFVPSFVHLSGLRCVTPCTLFGGSAAENNKGRPITKMNRCDKNDSPRLGIEVIMLSTISVLLSTVTVMVRVSNIILQEGTQRLNPPDHANNGKPTMVPGQLHLLSRLLQELQTTLDWQVSVSAFLSHAKSSVTCHSTCGSRNCNFWYQILFLF